MRKLPESFEKYGDIFTLEKRTDRVAMFRRERKDGKSRQWEVVKIEIRPEGEIDGRAFPERESVPKSSQWGERGKTFMDTPADRQRAEERFQQWVTESEAQLATA